MYSRNIENRERFFGVSGLLYRSNVLMYDRGTSSLWSQIKGEAVVGPMTGSRLEILPSRLTTWGKWREQYPESLVLSTDTGYARDYTKDPYLDYYQKPKGFWSFFKLGPGEQEKELVVGIELDGKTRAYPLEMVRERGEILDSFAGVKVTLKFDPATDRLQTFSGPGKELPHLVTYWFVWKGIHPRTGRFSSE